MTPTRRLADAQVFPIGLGGMPMSLSSRPPEEQSLRTIQAALDAGVNFIDTADAYSANSDDFGHNERLIAKALRRGRDDVLVATKGGHTRTADGGWELDGRPEYLKRACEASLPALGTDRIDLYQYHRPDPERPVRRVDRRAEGAPGRGQGPLGRHLQRRTRTRSRRRSRSPTSCPCRTSSRSSTPPRSTNGEVELCTKLGIAFLPWSPLGGISNAGDAAGAHDPVREAADAHGVSPQQVALAWLLSLSPVMIPIPGASRPESIADSAQAVGLELSQDELQAIGSVAAAA